MKKLALPDDILLRVDKPARYIGGELNAIQKDLDDIQVRIAISFPDVYEIGMSNLGIQIIYNILNKIENVYCERVYSPWVDLDSIMREKNIPLFALESQDPITQFDILGITVPYEMCYTNILQIIDLSQIPIWSKDRTESDPIVMGGGSCTYNPEPLADFFDIFYIGEAETVFCDMIKLYKEHKANGGSRQEFLTKAATIEGIYVPSLYEVSYHSNGTINAFEPINHHAPKKINRQVVTDMLKLAYPEKPIIPFIKATQDRIVLEIMRGCIRGCRFCQAGHVYRPTRNRDLEELKQFANHMLENTGHEEISLSSLSSSDYTHLQELIYYLIDEYKDKHVNISLPSLRIDEFSLDVMSKVQDIRKSSLTFAPEAGSQRLRNVINKGLSEEDILSGVKKAFDGGWNRVKLYFMLGLPTETNEDLLGIADLTNKVAAEFYTIPKPERPGNGRVEVTASTSFFVPKPFTPFQWARQHTMKEFLDKAYVVNHGIKDSLNRKSIKYNWHDAGTTILEGVLTRGDRKLSALIYTVYKKGSIFDAWTEHFKYDNWLAAFEETGIDVNFYTTRERQEDEIFPWDFINIGVTKEYLFNEWQLAKEEKTTPNCRQSCSSCGAMIFEGGVCFESKN